MYVYNIHSESCYPLYRCHPSIYNYIYQVNLIGRDDILKSLKRAIRTMSPALNALRLSISTHSFGQNKKNCIINIGSINVLFSFFVEQ